MAQNNYCIINTPIGRLGIVAIDKQVARINYLPVQTKPIISKNPVAKKAAAQLEKYFINPKTKFDLDFYLVGTKLQKKIWHSLLKIPAGKTVTYGELGKKIGTSPRVIGNACRCNPIPIIIPCHRVVAASGIGGYSGKKSGAKLKIKKLLLSYEQSGVRHLRSSV